MSPEWINWLNVLLNLAQFTIVVIVGWAVVRRLRAADAATAAQATAAQTATAAQATTAAQQWQESRDDRADLRTQLAGVQAEIGVVKNDQTELRKAVVQQQAAINRVIARQKRQPTHRDLETALTSLQANFALILAGRAPGPITVSQHNDGRAGGATFDGPTDIWGGVAGGNIGHIGPPSEGT